MSADKHANTLVAKHCKTRLWPTVFVPFGLLARNGSVWPEVADNWSEKGAIQRRRPGYTSTATLNSLRHYITMLWTIDLDAVSSQYVFASTNEPSCHVRSLARPTPPGPCCSYASKINPILTTITVKQVMVGTMRLIKTQTE